MRMWIFLIELIGYEKEGPKEPQLLLSVGSAPPEDSKSAEDNEDLFIGDIDEEDEFGYDEFDDDYDEEDYSGYDKYDEYEDSMKK